MKQTAWMRVKTYPLGVKLTLAIYALAFLDGTSVHLYVLLIGWQVPHHPFVNAYWTCLVALDPLALTLLLFFPRKGLLLAMGIMVSDVAVNSTLSYLELPSARPYAVNSGVQLETAFLGFVLGSLPFLWTYFGNKAK